MLLSLIRDLKVFMKKLKLSPVFLIASLLLVSLLLPASLWPTAVNLYLQGAQAVLVKHMSWLYILCVACIFVSVLYLGMSRFGDIRLGPDHSQPRFSYASWFAMLFSAGMGIGIMFFGVAEPVMHFSKPPLGEGGTVEAAKEALSITFFHWGLHAWSIYALVGLILSYFSYRHKLPLTLSSALYPFLGKKIRGPLGVAFDVFAIIGTIFGVAASLGYGVTQISSGLNAVFGWESSTGTQIALIILVTFIATASAVSGVEKGIRRLSEINLLLAVGLLILILSVGPTDLLFKTFLENTGNYLSDVVSKTFNLYAYNPTDWLGGWTLLYWAWWLSWSPFVGMFIARISYGRTIREFVMGVMIVPSLFNFLWMTVFGNSALNLILNTENSILLEEVKNDIASSLFSFLNFFPLSSVTSLVAIFMVLVFFITSADSGALVVNLLASQGKEKNPLWQKIYWSFLIGIVAIIFFVVGGLEALQTATILSALPFAFILLCAALGLKKALKVDYLKKSSVGVGISTPSLMDQEDWKWRIENMMNTPKNRQIRHFMTTTLLDSFQTVAKEFEKQGLNTKIIKNEDRVSLKIYHGEEIDFVYQVRIREYEPPSFTLSNSDSFGKSYYRAEVFLKEHGQNYDVMGYSKEHIISDVIDQYEKHLHFLSLIRQA